MTFHRHGIIIFADRHSSTSLGIAHCTHTSFAAGAAPYTHTCPAHPSCCRSRPFYNTHSVQVPTADARRCIRFAVVPMGPAQQAIVVEAVAEGSQAFSEAGIQRGLRLTGISDPVRRDEVWKLQVRRAGQVTSRQPGGQDCVQTAGTQVGGGSVKIVRCVCHRFACLLGHHLCLMDCQLAG